MIGLLLLMAFSADQVRADCSEFTDCSSCSLSNNTCGYCSFGGLQQGTGACYSAANSTAATSCVAEFEGSWIVSPDQCAAPNASCADYSSGCQACAAAPLSLNCGWCADGAGCLSGTPAQPDDSQACGASWDWQAQACSAQQLCNQRDHTNCTHCQQQKDCGWCSQSQRCETGSAAEPSVDDCDRSSWFYEQCDVPSGDECSIYSDSCATCENAPLSLQCGFCATSGVCATGNSSGPSQGVCVETATSTWSFQSCPADGVCEASSTCSQCNVLNHCLWCEGNQRCVPGDMTPIPSATCSGDTIPQWHTCPASHSSYPSQGAWAAACLAGVLLFFVLRAALYSVTHRRTPRLGTRLTSGRTDVSDFSVGWRRLFPALLALVTLVLKLVSLSIDFWDIVRFDDDTTDLGGGRTIYGLFQMRQEFEGMPTTTLTYAQRCKYLTEDYLAVCRTLRAGGVFTFLLALFSVVGSVTLLILALRAWRRVGGLQKHGVQLWRWTGLTHTGSVSALLAWVLCAHIILHWEDGAGIAASWILLLVSWLLELALLIFCRRMVASTPEEGHAGAEPVAREDGMAYQQQYAEAPSYASVSYGAPGGY